jgi:hypothetical protein
VVNFNFDCPHCGRVQTVTAHNYDSQSIFFNTNKTHFGKLGLSSEIICCANLDCQKPTVVISVTEWRVNSSGRYWVDGGNLLTQRLIPESSAKPQPDFIPAALRSDYVEACRIVYLSPKASATLARRCLQGMIRDFCGIKKETLFQEIGELRKRVDDDRAPKGVSSESVDAIDAVRNIGNIGAHMEKDINLIIDVEPDEAQTMIGLIETLFDEWYVEREKRKLRFAKVAAIAAAKGEQKRIGVAGLVQTSEPLNDNER